MDLKLPDLGEGVLEGEIVKWLVKAGDSIKEDQVVLEIMTDKATVEIPAKGHGVVTEILAKEGEIVKVGQTILKTNAGGSSATVAAPAPVAKALAPQAAKAAPASAKVAAPVPATFQNNDVQAAPAVRRLARDMGLDLSRVRGSGPHGRILLEDLTHGTSASNGQSAPRPWANTGARGERKEDHVPVRGLRRKIIEKMAQSKRTAAHFTYVEECDMTELNEFRRSLKPLAEAQGVKITFMPFVAKAVAIALKEFPALNATLVEEGGQPTEIIYKKYYNLGIAVDTEDGLTVPVVKDVDCKGFFEIAGEVAALAGKARDKKLSTHELQEGTFTITNAGNIGGLLATPVINYPEVAILGMHQMKRRPVVMANDKIEIRDIMYLSISLDHRVVDGAVAARFMNRLVGMLQNPKLMLAEIMGPSF
jgi:pyruvate dehydrogenase E2 component (dihydrolipoamide acetyltransferase)